MASLIYLASPYSHPSEAIRHHRYLAARRLSITLLQKGDAVFAPIVYGHDMETAIGTNFEPWKNLNDTMIEKCDRFWVLCLEDWQRSKGVRHELALASALDKPILYLDSLGTVLNVDT